MCRREVLCMCVFVEGGGVKERKRAKVKETDRERNDTHVLYINIYSGTNVLLSL